MSIHLKNALAALTLATGTLVFTSGAALAQRADFTLEENPTIFEAFEDAYFSHDRDFYRNRSLIRQVGLFFGLSYPENEIYRDGRAVNDLFNELYEIQASTTPLIRTPDLVNPYDTSLLTQPVAEEPQRDVRREPIPPIPAPPIQPAAPPPARPVPALW
jgi:hypothetical protein